MQQTNRKEKLSLTHKENTAIEHVVYANNGELTIFKALVVFMVCVT